MQPSLSDHELAQALAAVEAGDHSLSEQIDMLVEIAMRLQNSPRDVGQLQAAIQLYDRALSLLGENDQLAQARVMARRATALMQLPEVDAETVKALLTDLQQAADTLHAEGGKEEAAECDMNLGLALQSSGQVGSLPRAIQAYQRALRVFGSDSHPREYAILQSNLATAYLANPVVGNAGKMREALAVQAFEAALKVVSMREHPREYAMLQNNLGNALQYASSGHALQNNLRAVEAYEEALKVRTARDTPLEYANTLANMANCLSNLPDDPENLDAHREAGNPVNRHRARDQYLEAQDLFKRFGEVAKAAIVSDALQALQEGAAGG